jgi:hypothetical protein
MQYKEGQFDLQCNTKKASLILLDVYTNDCVAVNTDVMQYKL